MTNEKEKKVIPKVIKLVKDTSKQHVYVIVDLADSEVLGFNKEKVTTQELIAKVREVAGLPKRERAIGGGFYATKKEANETGISNAEIQALIQKEIEKRKK